MPTKTLTTEQFVAYMKKLQGDRTNAAFAKVLGVTGQHLGEIYAKPPRRYPGETIAKALGAERRVVFILGGQD